MITGRVVLCAELRASRVARSIRLCRGSGRHPVFVRPDSDAQVDTGRPGASLDQHCAER